MKRFDLKKKRRAKDQLKDLGVTPRRERGQNFLVDPDALDAIVAFGNPAGAPKLVEIGPGLGALTARLLEYGPVTAIEIERRFCDALRASFGALTVIEQDVRQVDFGELGSGLVVFGNVPYSISTEIVFRLLEFRDSIRRAVLLLQREFAERIAAPPGGKSYGVLSIAVQLWSDAKLGPIIPGDRFHPPTEVASRVIELTFLQAPRFAVSDPLWFKRVVGGAFRMRRKKIHNSLKAATLVPAGGVDRALEAAGIDPSRRPETLSIEEFVRLAEALRATLPVEPQPE